MIVDCLLNFNRPSPLTYIMRRLDFPYKHCTSTRITTRVTSRFLISKLSKNLGRLRTGPGLQTSISGFFWKVDFCPSVLTSSLFYRTASDLCLWLRALNNLASGFPGAASGIFRKLQSGLRRVLATENPYPFGPHSQPKRLDCPATLISICGAETGLSACILTMSSRRI